MSNQPFEVKFFGLNGFAVTRGTKVVSVQFRTEAEALEALAKIEDGIQLATDPDG